jgi:hypothetical protein
MLNKMRTQLGTEINSKLNIIIRMLNYVYARIM